jgi:Ca2+-binding EF-hand superfamily protein
MQLQLKKLLLTISKGEKSIERQRQRLAKNDKFEPYAAFMRVDRDENGVIGSVEILRFLRENGVEEATEADCFLIVKYFDSDEDGYLNFQDFLQLLLPCDNQALRSNVV